jgi:hypothetical protein
MLKFQAFECSPQAARSLDARFYGDYPAARGTSLRCCAASAGKPGAFDTPPRHQIRRNVLTNFKEF